MSELAFNLNGEPFDVPPTMAAWRVRRLKPKGAPEVVYGRDGLPLFLPMDADVEDLRREARADGRYRLDPVDDHNRTVPNAQASYVCVHPVEHAPEPVAAVSAAADQTDAMTQLIGALLESQKQHTELARMYVAQFPVLVNALSGVVRSAGDAGLPARVPLVVPVTTELKPADPTSGANSDGEDDEDDDEDEDDERDEDDEEEIEIIETLPEPEWSWPKFAATALETFSPQINLLLGQLPHLGATLGARRAERAAGAANASTMPTSDAPATDVAAHLAAIRAALTPEEATSAMALLDELSMMDKFTYVQKLRAMSVPDAVSYVRDELAALARNRARDSVTIDAADGAPPEGGRSEAEIDARLDAICAALTPEECKTLRMMLEELVFEHRLIWLDKLCSISVPEGVAFVREKLAEAQRDARARGGTEPRIVRTPEAAPAAAPDAAPARPTTPRPSASDRLRRAGRRVAGSPAPSESSPTTSTAPTGGAPTARLVAPAMQAHVDAIQRALTADENGAVRAHLAALSSAERSAWLSHLLTLSVPDAVAQIRAQHGAAPLHLPRAEDAMTTSPTSEAPRNRANSSGATVPASPADAAVLPALTSAVDAVPATDPVPTAAVELAAHPTPAVPVGLAPTAAAPAAASTEAPASTAPAAGESNADAHLVAIELALTAGERFLVHAQVAQMSPEAREILLDDLLSASVPQGAAILRAQIQQLSTAAPSDDRGAETAPVLGEVAPDAPRAGDGPTLDAPRDHHAAAANHPEPANQPQPANHVEPTDGLEVDDDLDDDDLNDGLDDGLDDDLDGDLDDAPEGDDAAAPGPIASRARAAVPVAGLPTLAPDAFPHFKAIESALTLAERLRVFELGAQLSPAQLRVWVGELAALPAPQAVARIRAALGEADRAASAKKGGVS